MMQKVKDSFFSFSYTVVIIAQVDSLPSGVASFPPTAYMQNGSNIYLTINIFGANQQFAVFSYLPHDVVVSSLLHTCWGVYGETFKKPTAILSLIYPSFHYFSTF